MNTTHYPNWLTLAQPVDALNTHYANHNAEHALAAAEVAVMQLRQIVRQERESLRLGRASQVEDGVLVPPSLLKRGESYGGIDV